MGNVRFIGCLHLGHENMAKYRGFSSSEEHDSYLIKQWNSVVNKKDKVFILGDITMEKATHYPILKQLRGQKTVVLGNHDRPHDIPELLKYVSHVGGMIKYRGFFLTHCPVHPIELEYRSLRGNIHAHVHEKTIDDPKYFNVDALKLDFKPILFKEILENYE